MPDPSSSWTPFLPDRQTIRSLSTPGGRRYRLAVSHPCAAAPQAGFASIMVLDGGRHFQAVASAAETLSLRSEKTGVEPLVVIGVFHDEAEGEIENARARDFTSTACPEPGWSRPHGEAADFRRFLVDQVLPGAAEVAPLDPDRRTLFGHSLGGLFVLETLETEPRLFSRWVSISPSLWWRTPDVANADEALLLGYGEMETGRDMRRRIEAWSAQAAGRGRRLRVRMAPWADHGSAPFTLIPEALRQASSNRWGESMTSVCTDAEGQHFTPGNTAQV